MVLTKGKVMWIFFNVGFLWYFLLHAKEKVNMAKLLGITDQYLQTGFLVVATVLCISVFVAMLKLAKRFESSPTDFGYTLLLGAMTGMITGSLIV